MKHETADVIVVGAGLAGLSAALTARESGRSVLVLECAPQDERGGNSRFSNGAMRAVYDGVADIERLVDEIGPGERARTDFGHYTREQYFEDMGRVTQYRADPVLTELLVESSRHTMLWLRRHGVRFMPLYQWQQRYPDGRIRFAGGSAVETYDGGEGLSNALFAAAEKAGVRVAYGTRAMSLIAQGNRITGVAAKRGYEILDITGRAVVLATGGFEANPEWRTRYLGPGFELAKVRGSRFNTGGGLQMALAAGAQPFGHWSGCHSASWDLNAPDVNELAYGTVFKRDDYMFGIMVNLLGQRFVDEGADVRALTYAKLGRVVLAQPAQMAWQVYDGKTSPLLHEEYRHRRSARLRADTLEELAGKMEGIDRAAFLRTVAEFNKAVRRDVPFDSSGAKDGRGTTGLAIPKSNWAETIDTPPFEAYGVTCGVTFTFGGLRVAADCNVIDVDGQPVPGLFAAGEIVGGLFYFNYPGGAGLMAAAVFGRVAGAAAATSAASRSAAAAE
jgi:tricarballylate dehydrogenase